MLSVMFGWLQALAENNEQQQRAAEYQKHTTQAATLAAQQIADLQQAVATFQVLSPHCTAPLD